MPVQFKDYYAILGVPREASEDEIKKAFRKLARKHHPDVAKDKKASEAKFKEINEANEVLSDPLKRRKYDQLGARWNEEPQFSPRGAGGGRRQGGGTQGPDYRFDGTGFSDFFEQFFGGNRGPGGAGDEDGFSTHGPTFRGGDIQGDILVTLEEAIQGTTRPVSLQTADPRTGKPLTRSFQVRIPPGAVDGSRIRVPGQGEPGAGGAEAGDLYLRVRHAAHPDFEARGADLHHELRVAPWEAVLGGEAKVPALDGAITVRIPPGSDNGQRLRVRGRGLPKGKAGERGDLYAVLSIGLPPALSSEERAAWEKLRAVSKFDPRGEGAG